MSETEQVLDEVAQLLESGRFGGSSGKPQRSLLLMGTHVSGTLDSWTCDEDLDLVGMCCAVFSGLVMVTNGRTVSSFGQGFHPGGGCRAICAQNMMWFGRVRFHAGDIVYVDTSAAMTNPGCVLLMFEPVN